MKNNIVTTVFLLIAGAACATVRTVSNMVPSPGQYTSIDAAIAASSNGDTILVQGSTFNYLNATVNKQLTIIGTGHNVQNQNPRTADLDNLYFTSGSSGSTIIGMNLYNVQTQQSNITNVTITRCRIRYQINTIHNTQNWTIDGNYFEYTGNCLQGNNVDNDFLTIKNNIFNGYLQSLNANGNNTNLVIKNNIFLHNSLAYNDVRYAYHYNNIYYRAQPSLNTTGGDWEGNMSYQCVNNNFPSGSNYPNVNPMFVNFPAAGAVFSYAYDFHFQPGSPAITAGNDGLDLGVWGGLGNYERGGIPSIPQIRSFTITGSNQVAPGGNININVSSTIKQ